jgi:hypothetical protein
MYHSSKIDKIKAEYISQTKLKPYNPT